MTNSNNIKFPEFMKMLMEQIVLDVGGYRVVDLSIEELLFHSKYQYRMILDWWAASATAGGTRPDLGEFLDRLTRSNSEEPWPLTVSATDADLRALGRLLLNSWVGVFLFAGHMCAELKPIASKYAGQ
jgi:hypothetical protein